MNVVGGHRQARMTRIGRALLRGGQRPQRSGDQGRATPAVAGMGFARKSDQFFTRTAKRRFRLAHQEKPMPLLFHPDPGAIVICDFSRGFQPPEMVKKRPVLVVSPRRRRVELPTVVPLSTAEPRPILPHHIELQTEDYPPGAGRRMWAKCDMIQTVALARCDRVMMRGPDGQRRYQVFQASPATLAAVRTAIKELFGC